MRIIDTSQLQPEHLSRSEGLYIYNGLDCCITYEVLDQLLPQLTPTTRATYEFSRALQGPILEMNMRGLRVDYERREEVLASYRMDIVRLESQLDAIVRDGIGTSASWRSPKQLGELLYDVMGLPEQRKRGANGERVRTVDRDALEKLEHYFYAEPIIRHLLALRDLGKKVSFLSTAIDPDGRLRTSFNIAGTTTGRLASSYSDFGTGTNLQNVENRLRSVFVADPGFKFGNIDLEQGDSRGVGAIHWNLFRDARYLDACESGDLHTTVARGAFRRLPWTGDLRIDRSIASDTKFYRELSYRDASKRLGHGSNYIGQPEQMSKATHIPLADVKTFQRDYLPAFFPLTDKPPSWAKRDEPYLLWWKWIEEQIRDTRKLTSLLGRQRYFFGHWKDPETIRGAVAYEPQSITADTIDRGLLALWRENRVQVLLQVHDSILFQFREEEEDEIIPWALETIQQRQVLKEGREFVIPGEAKTGWNWSDNPDDPDALRKWKGGDSRKRTRKPGLAAL